MTTINPKFPLLRATRRTLGLITPISPSSPVDVVTYDTFTDTDATNLTSHTMNTGAGWTALVGSITVVSNAAVCQNASNAYVVECGRPDVTITCDYKCGAANASFAPSILIRAKDNNNYIQVYFDGDGDFLIWQKLGGVLTTYKSGGVWSADTNWHTAKVICESTTVSVYCDNVLIWQDEIVPLAGNTKFGILGFASGGNKDSFDNFRVTANRRNDDFPGEFISNSFTDTFTQADTTRLNTFGWTENIGTWAVTSNKAGQSLTGGVINGYVVSRDVGVHDVGLEVAITTPASGGFIAGLAFSLIDKNHYIEAEINTTQGGFGVWYTDNTPIVTPVYKELARQNPGAFTPANSTTYTMRVRVKGQVITAELVEPGIKLITHCDKFLSATRVGLFEFRNGTYANGCAYDDFKVYQ